MLHYSFGFIVLMQLILFGTVDRIQKALEKKEYEKAEELIIKGLEKEPQNAGVSYYQAKLLFDPAYKNYSVDSARLIIYIAWEKLNKADASQLEDLKEDGITKEKIRELFDQIRDKIFQRTLQNLSIETATSFQAIYPESVYDDILTFKVDSMQFKRARQIGSQEAFISFIEKNPTSVFKPKADSILDHLRVNRLRKSGTLNDYYSFLDTYPLTRFRSDVEAYILKVSTASGSTQSLKEFLALSKVDHLSKRAADVLYYKSPSESLMLHPLKDSIDLIADLAKIQLFPIVNNSRLGFYDTEGVKRIEPVFDEIPDPYKCELIEDDWIYVKANESGKVITKIGQVVLDDIENYQSIREEVGIIQRNKDKWLYHKSGFQILDESIEDAKPLDNDWISVRQNGKWGLVTILGFQIAESRYDEIYKLGTFYVFEKDQRLAAYTKADILDEIEDKGLSLEFKFDDIELVNNNALIGFRGERECLLDSTLNFLIPWGEYEIYPEESGWYLKSEQGYRLYNPAEADIMDQHYKYLESNNGWLAIKTDQDWMLLPRIKEVLPSRGYDSIKLVTDYSVILLEGDERTVLFSSGKELTLSDENVLAFPERSEYLRIKSDNAIRLFDKDGNEVLSNNFESISFLNDTLLKVQIRGKQGLIHTNGDWILNPVFNNLDEKNGLILTLIDGKIGCYDPIINELIETGYESRLTRIKEHYLAKKEGKYGVIDFASQEVISFNYDEINMWNDSTYLVKKNQAYSIIDGNEDPVFEPFESVKLLVEASEHNIYRFIKDGKYGLLSNRYGELLTPEFTDIFNVGNADHPVLFADQHLSKAGFHVVSYIDQKGNLILSKAYTIDEFEKVLCDD
ncbi:WG repeat-containing protein [Ekhidna sp.]|uniref:WG repeat-containing protein n=1 Tax=Ekhidna sp. TaxID=2608089 RepID=UPI003CCBEA93